MLKNVIILLKEVTIKQVDLNNFDEKNIEYIRQNINNENVPNKAYGPVLKNNGPTKVLIKEKSRKISANILTDHWR